MLQDNGTITVHLPKLEAGQNFPDLDMLTKLTTIPKSFFEAEMESEIQRSVCGVDERIR